MDTITHIVLGGCIGEVVAGRQLGKKALILGAFAQSIPDLDFVASFWLSTTSNLLAHRGFTHSFLFIALLSPLLALIARKVFSQAGMTLKHWSLFWALEMFVHVFIDAFNAYGTGWFEPFSHYRVSFNTMFVADPLFSIWPTIAFVMLLCVSTAHMRRKKWAKIAIAVCSIYLFIGIANKLYISDAIKTDFHAKKIAFSRVLTTPTPLNNLLWYAVAQTDTGFYIGYRSVFDKLPSTDFHFVPRREALLVNSGNPADVAWLVRFSQGYYTVGMLHDSLIFNDLRFGEIGGWNAEAPAFVFYYYLQYPNANELIVQRGRLARWDKKSLAAFWNRICGI